jgi:hypothetical protein
MDPEKPKPRLSEGGRRAALEREARRARALRLNLRKRKAQARERSAGDLEDDAGGKAE